MCYNNKLCIFCQLVQIFCVAGNIGIIQGRLNLIQQAEGGRLQVLDGKQQCYGGQGFLTAGELHHILQFFARGLGYDTDACLQDIRILIQFKCTFSAAEQLFERFVKFDAYL